MTCEKCWKDLYSKEDFNEHITFCIGFMSGMCEENYENDVNVQTESESQVKNKKKYKSRCKNYLTWYIIQNCLHLNFFSNSYLLINY